MARCKLGDPQWGATARFRGQLLAAHPAWPVARLAQMLAEKRDRLGRLAAGDLQVRAAFAVSYGQLAEGDHQQLSILRSVATAQQDGQTEYPACQDVDDLEQHLASQPSPRLGC
jgi:hypothetical protein